MDLAEATQRIAWLDEMHRADEQCLNELQKQVESQSAIITELNRRVETLMVELTRTRDDLRRFDQIEAAMAHGDQDLHQRLAREAAERETAEKKARERDMAQANLVAELSRVVQSLQDELGQIRAQVIRLPGRVEEQVAQAGALIHEIESIEARLGQAQAQATGLDGRLSQQTGQTAHLLRQIQSLEVRLGQTQSQLMRFPQIEAAVARAKEELTALIKEQEMRRREEMTLFAQARQREREIDSQAVVAIARQLEILPRLQERIQAREIEDKRFFEALPRLEARDTDLAVSIEEKTARLPYVEERLRREIERITVLEQQATMLEEAIETRTSRLPYLDEQVARDAVRIAALERSHPVLEKAIQDKTARIPYLAELIDGVTERVDAIEPEIVVVKRRDEELADKIRFLDTWAQRSAEKITELERFEARIQEAHDKFANQIQFSDAARTRQLDTWSGELVEQRKQLEAWAKELKHYAEMYEWARTVTLALDDLGKQLTLQQQEVQEWLRLEVDKQKKELSAWETDWAKQWALFVKQADWKWVEEAKVDRQHSDRADQFEAWRQQDVARVDELVKRLQDQDKAHYQRIVELWQTLEDDAKYRVVAFRKWMEEFDLARNQRLRPPSPGPRPQVETPKVGPESAERR